MLSFSQFNESYQNLGATDFDTLRAKFDTFDEFENLLQEEFDKKGFLFVKKDRTLAWHIGGSTVYVNGIPMHFTQGYGNGKAEYSLKFSQDLMVPHVIDLIGYRIDTHFQSVEQIVNFFKAYLPQYTKKLMVVNDFGILEGYSPYESQPIKAIWKDCWKPVDGVKGYINQVSKGAECRKEFNKRLKEAFVSNGFTFKYKQSAYVINGLPMYIQSSDRFVFQTEHPKFPNYLKDTLEDVQMSGVNLYFFNVGSVVDFFETYLSTYTKKLAKMHDAGIL